MIEVPYLAAFAVTRAFLPDMLARRSGHIVCVTSPASYMVWANACAYVAARQALKGFSDALRVEVARHGLFVSLVVLGTTETPYWEHNPGSREHVPRGFAPLTTDAAAAAVMEAIVGERKRVFRPRLFRFLMALEGIAPGITARG